MSGIRKSAKLVLGFSMVVASPAVVSAQEVGTAAAVNPAAQARGAGGSRTVVIGQSILHRERIQTTSAGSVQLLFVDKTSMTIGPNSDLTIDEYVFDPVANTGKLSASLAKGVMRFVGGQVSHTGSAEIKTSNGVVGIRGGVGLIGTSMVYIGFGQGTVRSGSSSVVLDAGEYTEIRSGTPPTLPGPPPPGLIGKLLANFQSQNGQGGGAPASDRQVEQARAGVTGSPSGPVVTLTFGNNGEYRRFVTMPQTSVNSVNQTIVTSRAQTVAIASTPTQTPRQQPPTEVVNPTPRTTTDTVPPTMPIPFTPPTVVDMPRPTTPQPTNPPQSNPPPPFSTGPAFTFAMSNCCGGTGPASSAPYLPVGFATGANSFVSQGIGYRPTSVANATLSTNLVSGPAPATFLQWGLGITGSGADQSSWLSVMTGVLAENGNNVTFSGGFGATRRGAGNLTMGRASGFMSSTANSVVLDAQGVPLSATINQQDFVAATNQYRNVQAQASATGTSGFQPYDFTQQVTRTIAPTALGQFRPEQVLSGWTGGLMQTSSSSSTSAPFATAGVAQIILDPTQARVQATFDVVNVTPRSLDHLLVGRFQLGSVNPSQPAQSAYVDYDNFAAREAVTVNQNGAQRTQLSSINLQRPTASTTIMVNVPRDVARTILPNTTICDCDYTRWGFWSTDSQRSTLLGGSRTDRGHMMTWVAGQLPKVSEVPATGSATYTGHVVANVSNNGAQYIASGNMSNTVDFGARSGTASVSNFDGANYSGRLQLGADPRFLGAGLSSDTGNRSMAMTGSFFRGAAGPVGEMGGNVNVIGQNYLGSGIFAGRAR